MKRLGGVETARPDRIICNGKDRTCGMKSDDRSQGLKLLCRLADPLRACASSRRSGLIGSRSAPPHPRTLPALEIVRVPEATMRLPRIQCRGRSSFLIAAICIPRSCFKQLAGALARLSGNRATIVSGWRCLRWTTSIGSASCFSPFPLQMKKRRFGISQLSWFEAD